MSRARAIEHYALYGEAQTRLDPDFFHIEGIGARSLIHDWHIRPHTHPGMAQFVFLAGGRARVRLDEAEHDVAAPCAVVIPGGVVHGFEFEPATEGYVVTVADALAAAAPERPARAAAGGAQLVPRVLDFAAGTEAFARIRAILGELEHEFRWPQRGRNAMLEWLFRSLLMLLLRQVDLQQVRAGRRGGRHETFTRFRRLVEERYAEHWDIGAYARALSVTPATLHRLCRQFAGKGALELIQERLIVAARRHLLYTDASVETIAYGLGFQDPAYFSRFFKRHTALAPGRFRQARHAAA